ncbi:hypothetical protein D5018_00085 [Parashewanella curva]|uniref:Uncharacterized protein n=1 Tax=Parashewanella curva TaxID=2338552 RepID=A0A3L8Q1T8_9GAMM|nr:hypothetical protein [Parashewanella curva]RLV61554.1 hypothetical protein D5018_00085 [Parashewanella curva]
MTLKNFAGVVTVKEVGATESESIKVRYEYNSVTDRERKLELFFDGEEVDSKKSQEVAKVVSDEFFNRILLSRSRVKYQNRVTRTYGKIKREDWTINTTNAHVSPPIEKNKTELLVKEKKESAKELSIESEKTMEVLQPETEQVISLPKIGSLPLFITVADESGESKKLNLHQYQSMISLLHTDIKTLNNALSGIAQKGLLLAEFVVAHRLKAECSSVEVSFGKAPRLAVLEDRKFPVLVDKMPYGFIKFKNMDWGNQVMVTLVNQEQQERKVCIYLPKQDDLRAYEEMEQKNKCEQKLSQKRQENFDTKIGFRAQMLRQQLADCDSVKNTNTDTQLTREDFQERLLPEVRSFNKN